MVIKVGNDVFGVIDWIDENRELKLHIHEEEKTLAQMAAIFETAEVIDVYDKAEDQEPKSSWYPSRLISINKDSNGDAYEIKLAGSLLDSDAEGRLNDSVSDTEDAILEIAEMFATLEGTQQDSDQFIKQYKERVEDLIRQTDGQTNQNNARFNEQTRLIEGQVQMVTELQLAITALQDALRTVPKNTDERISNLETRFNLLADRIARLENGGN